MTFARTDFGINDLGGGRDWDFCCEIACTHMVCVCPTALARLAEPRLAPLREPDQLRISIKRLVIPLRFDKKL